ncbi:hypothetical protein CGRA01v4_14529 [Colletotrichum graminicola]|uniref:Ribosomal protein bL31m N-terminal domain-containing protein n=1 Tax=Colletotrichum graminicola (strain M1.001 / M2 / FGSC 10212) TaxID=645133 RepID=E3Q4R8_COLGM|nr:uncharacterized protein GLRG_01227 [Colletotrichum graminicola M1.001]EFQ26083.1 hypothetical protein GLRG_01227 [Colletotrichum graminicola M1.001]WDK23237.1 hypothetical protein CGRA01v4_14529 [Colletotrichum graminicola]
MGKLPTHLPRPTSLLCHRPRTSISITSSCSSSPLPYNASTPVQRTTLIQTRAATFVPRARRPYTFTQLIQLSDGSAYTVRTTSPAALVRSAKDTRNHALWLPSEKTLQNVELDEAGKLAAFRERFGRGFDIAAGPAAQEETAAAAADAAEENKAPVTPAQAKDDVFDMGDLISGYAALEPKKVFSDSKKGSRKKKN